MTGSKTITIPGHILALTVSMLLNLVISLGPLNLQAEVENPNPLRASAELTLPSAESKTAELLINVTLDSPYKAYSERFKVRIAEPEGASVGPLALEPLVEFVDTFSKTTKKGMKGEGTIRAEIQLPQQDPKSVKVMLTYQACTTEHCLFPKTVELDPVVRQGVLASDPKNRASDEVNLAIGSEEEITDFAKALQKGLFSAILFMFIAGFLTSLTPCIYPMIPITLAILGANTKPSGQPGKAFQLRAFFLSVFYVLGIATTYSILGVAAASTGALFGSALSNIWVVTVLAALFVLMGLSMYGVFEIQAPAFIRDRMGQGKSEAGFFRSYATGLAAGVVASPCVGPVLVSVLAYIAQTQDRMLGLVLLFSFAMGMGLLFIALGTSSALLKSLPKAGGWMDGVKFLFGTTMVGMALYYVEPVYPTWLFRILLGTSVILIASAFGAFSSSETVTTQIRKGAALASFVVGTLILSLGALERFGVLSAAQSTLFANGSVVSRSNQGSADTASFQKLDWQSFSDSHLQEAVASGKPVILDFWADWCGACHELEELTFVDQRVRELSKEFVLLKLDATNDSPLVDRLKKQYGVMGLPTLIFMNGQAQPIQRLTLTGFEKADLFLARMEKALATVRLKTPASQSNSTQQRYPSQAETQ